MFIGNIVFCTTRDFPVTRAVVFFFFFASKHWRGMADNRHPI